MRKILSVATALLVAGSAAGAQTVDPQCQNAGQPELRDGCQKAIDIFNYMAPQLGTVIAGGNATLGQGGTLGGFPHFAIGLRANAIMGSLPDIEGNTPSTGGTAIASTYQTEDQPLGLPSIDAAIGLFAGIPVPFVTKIGGVDLLLSAAYVPEYSKDDISITVPDGSLKVGYGVRVGLLEESFVVPGVAVTYFKRDLPTANILGVSGDDSISVNNLALETTAWRVTASKSFFIFGLALGAGQDKYSSAADLAVSVQDGPLPTDRYRGEPFSFSQEVTRTNYFADLSFNILLAKFVGEVGMVSGGEIPTYNQFEGKKADDSRLYGSVGLRIGF